MTAIKTYLKDHLSIKQRMAVKSAASVIVPYRLRYASGIWTKFRFLEKSQYFPVERQEWFQLAKLRETLLIALTNNPYYQVVFGEIGLDEKEIRNSHDINELLMPIPFLTKDDVRSNLDVLINGNADEKELVHKTTSGSTGNPLTFVNSKECLEWEEAFMWRHWKNASRWTPGGKMAFLRSYIPDSRRNDPVYYYDPWTKIHWFSAYNMNDENLSVYADILDKIKPDILVGYPSSVFVLVEYLSRNKKTLEIPGIVTSSESLPDYQRDVVESVFNVKVSDNYGLTERVVGLGRCACGGGYHDWYEYGITEIIDENGNRITTPGMTGEIVGTNFTNSKALPWIRYRTGDIAEYIEPVLCECGSQLPIITRKIIGRTDDILYSNNGCRVPGVNFYTMFQKYVRQIRNFQLFQSSRDRIEIRLVVTEAYCSHVGENLKRQIRQRVGAAMTLDIQLMDQIPREANGKYKCIKRDKKIDLFWNEHKLQEAVV